jgi:hypothetical protein
VGTKLAMINLQRIEREAVLKYYTAANSLQGETEPASPNIDLM